MDLRFATGCRVEHHSYTYQATGETQIISLLGVSSTKGDCMPLAAETNGQPESEG